MSTAPIPNFGLASFSMSAPNTYDPLLSDGHDVVSRKGSLTLGQGLVKRGTLMSFNPTTGVVVLADGGANAPNSVAAENVDATTAAADILLYVTGKMKADAIIWPATGSRSLMADKLRDYGIYIESVLLREGNTTASVAAVTLTPTSASAVEAGVSATFAVAKDTAGGPGTWFPTVDVPWLTITAPTVPQTADGNVSYTVAAQPVGIQPARSGHIYVNGQTFTVNQAVGT